MTVKKIRQVNWQPDVRYVNVKSTIFTVYIYAYRQTRVTKFTGFLKNANDLYTVNEIERAVSWLYGIIL